VLTVLIQKPQGGGISGAFGGGGGSGQTAFGTKTGDALTIFTIIVFVVYLLFAIGLNFSTRPSAQAAPTPTATAPAAPAAPSGSPSGAPAPAADETQPNPATPAPTGSPAPTGAPAPTPT